MDAAGVSVVSSRDGRGGLVVRVGIPLVDLYLEFLGGRCRPNTVLAAPGVGGTVGGEADQPISMPVIRDEGDAPPGSGTQAPRAWPPWAWTVA